MRSTTASEAKRKHAEYYTGLRNRRADRITASGDRAESVLDRECYPLHRTPPLMLPRIATSVLMLGLMLGAVTSRASAQEVVVQPLPAQPAVARTAQDSALQLRAGDVLRVAIWREPGLSGDFQLDESGYVTLPLLGRRRADATPWILLRDSIVVAFRRQVRAESITLTPLRRLYVLGAVLRPGVYVLDPTFGLEGAISLAGGAGLDGNLERVRILRGGKTIAERVSLTKSANEYDVRSGDQLFVDRRGWADRNSALLLTSFLTLAGLVATIATRR